MRTTLTTALLALLLWTATARPQLLVFDEQNFIPNTATLVQTARAAMRWKASPG